MKSMLTILKLVKKEFIASHEKNSIFLCNVVDIMCNFKESITKEEMNAFIKYLFKHRPMWEDELLDPIWKERLTKKEFNKRISDEVDDAIWSDDNVEQRIAWFDRHIDILTKKKNK